MINFQFTDEQKALREKIIEHCQSFLNKDVAQRDKNQQFDKTIWKSAGQLKLMGLPVSEDFGGKGLDIISTVHALEALGYGCLDNGLSFAIGAHLLSCVIPIWQYGTEDQKKNYLPSLCNGESIIANAITEASSGSDAFNMQTTAHKQNGGYVINGEKKYSSNAPVSDSILVYVKTNDSNNTLNNISAFIIENKELPPIKPKDKMGLRTCLMGDITFENVKVSNSKLLGQEGSGMLIFSNAMIWERIGLSAIHLGTMERLLEKAISYSKSRESGSKKISKYQSIAHKLVNLKAEINSAKWTTYHAAWCLEKKQQADMYASIAKLNVSELYKKTSSMLMHLHGAESFIKNNDISRTYRDAAASTLYSGSSEVQMNRIASWMGL